MSTCNQGRCGVDHEFKLASCDIKRTIDQYGAPVLIRFNVESDVKRDKYGSIKNRVKNDNNKFNPNAFPITFSPTDKQKSNAGIRENTDVIIWTAMLDWMNAEYTIEDLNSIKADVILNGRTYEIVDKSLKDQFGLNFLYVVLGLNEK